MLVLIAFVGGDCHLPRSWIKCLLRFTHVGKNPLFSEKHTHFPSRPGLVTKKQIDVRKRQQGRFSLANPRIESGSTVRYAHNKAEPAVVGLVEGIPLNTPPSPSRPGS